MRLLILGGSGLLGTELIRQGLGRGDSVVGTFVNAAGYVRGAGWRQLDIRNRAQTVALFRAIRPDLVINAAFRQSEWSTTAVGAANAAIAAGSVGARSVLVSSDAVFSGLGSMYTESDDPDPIIPYGAAKAAAETAVRAIDPDSIVVRTSLIVSDDGRSEHERRSHAAARGQGVLFVDDVRCPVHVSDLAAATLELAAGSGGVRHAAGPEAMSRYDLGCAIAVRDGLDPGLIRQANRAELQVSGPIDVRLDSSATQQMIRTRLRGASDFLTTSRS